MKSNELREQSTNDLAVRAKELAEELFKLKFQHGIRPLENPAKLGQLRKDIARVKTILNAKRKAEAAG